MRLTFRSPFNTQWRVLLYLFCVGFPGFLTRSAATPRTRNGVTAARGRRQRAWRPAKQTTASVLSGGASLGCPAGHLYVRCTSFGWLPRKGVDQPRGEHEAIALNQEAAVVRTKLDQEVSYDRIPHFYSIGAGSAWAPRVLTRPRVLSRPTRYRQTRERDDRSAWLKDAERARSAEDRLGRRRRDPRTARCLGTSTGEPAARSARIRPDALRHPRGSQRSRRSAQTVRLACR
jgi:hypothetical protein